MCNHVWTTLCLLSPDIVETERWGLGCCVCPWCFKPRLEASLDPNCWRVLDFRNTDLMQDSSQLAMSSASPKLLQQIALDCSNLEGIHVLGSDGFLSRQRCVAGHKRRMRRERWDHVERFSILKVPSLKKITWIIIWILWDVHWEFVLLECWMLLYSRGEHSSLKKSKYRLACKKQANKDISFLDPR